MNNFETVIDFGSKNLRLAIFDETSRSVYSSKKNFNSNFQETGLEKSLNTLIRDAEKHLSMHIDSAIVLYDSPKFYSIDVSIKKLFDQPISIEKVYSSLIEEANFIVSQNNFKDQLIHLIVNNVVVDDKKILGSLNNDIEIQSLIIEIKFIFLNKSIIKDISNIFKNNNLNISNFYCSSYVKTFFYKKNFNTENYFIFFDIGFEKTSCFIFNNNKFEFFNSIPIGGNNITKDISKILNLSLDYSENLKIKFNENENDVSLNKNYPDQINPYSEILEKNISVELLKKIIEARVDEIIELAINKNIYKIINNFEKPKVIFIGSGSKFLSKSYNLTINKSASDFTLFDEIDSNICEAGLNYLKSDESFLIQTKKKPKKLGFFENFFNLFSK